MCAAAMAAGRAGKGRPKVFIHVVSDATGTAAERMARAAMAQFRDQFDSIFHRHPFVRGRGLLTRLLDEAREQRALFIYTINDRGLRQWLARQAERRPVPMVDMLGPLFSVVEERYDFRPRLDASLLRGALGEKSLRLAEAIDFTLRHDDGNEIATLGRADVILVGVSRTSKTPTSLYLSCNHGLKVANVPLVLGMEPPDKIFSLRRPRKVGLTIHPHKLAAIRRGRFRQRVLDGYSDPATVNQELAYSEEVFARMPEAMVIDVTDRPIEEVASLIL